MMYGENMRAWLSIAQEFIKKIAIENGAVALVAQGRGGWLRVFKARKNGRDYEVNLHGQ